MILILTLSQHTKAAADLLHAVQVEINPDLKTYDERKIETPLLNDALQKMQDEEDANVTHFFILSNSSAVLMYFSSPGRRG